MTDSKGMTPEERARFCRMLRFYKFDTAVAEIERLAAAAEEVERLRAGIDEWPLEGYADLLDTFSTTQGLNRVQVDTLRSVIRALRAVAALAEPVGDDPAPTLWCPQCFEHDHNPVASCCYQCGERLTTAAAEGDPAPTCICADREPLMTKATPEGGPRRWHFDDCPLGAAEGDPVPQGEQP